MERTAGREESDDGQESRAQIDSGRFVALQRGVCGLSPRVPPRGQEQDTNRSSGRTIRLCRRPANSSGTLALQKIQRESDRELVLALDMETIRIGVLGRREN